MVGIPAIIETGGGLIGDIIDLTTEPDYAKHLPKWFYTYRDDPKAAGHSVFLAENGQWIGDGGAKAVQYFERNGGLELVKRIEKSATPRKADSWEYVKHMFQGGIDSKTGFSGIVQKNGIYYDANRAPSAPVYPTGAPIVPKEQGGMPGTGANQPPSGGGGNSGIALLAGLFFLLKNF